MNRFGSLSGMLRRSAGWGALLGCVTSLLLGCPVQAHERASGASIVRDILPIKVGDAVPDAPFIDQAGHPFSLRTLRSKTVVLAFMYTRCPDPNECPLITANMAALQRRLGAGPFALAMVTLDPDYDSPARLREYARRFEADTRSWHFLTGDEKRVLDFAAYFNVTRFDDPQRGVIHNDRTVIIDPQGRLNTIIDETGWSPVNVEAQMRAASAQPSNPLARLDLWLSKGFVAVCGNGIAGSSGLLDLIVLLTITVAFGWAFYRLGRLVFTR